MSTMPKKMDNRNIQDLLSLTPMQEGMLFHYIKNPENQHYFEQLCLHMQGEIHLDAFRSAWQHVIDTNEMLRVVYRWEKLQKPIQLVLKQYEVPIRIYDARERSAAAKDQTIVEVKRNDQIEGIDLRTEPFRVTLILLDDNDSMMMITHHHILYDGWSNGIILKEFFQVYRAFVEGVAVEIRQKTPFKEFVRWLQNQNQSAMRQYWGQYLSGFESRTQLPGANDKLNAQETLIQQYASPLDADMTDALTSFARENQLTPAAIFYSVWGILLQRYTNAEDVVFGTTVSGRNAEIGNIEEMVGLMINTIPLRVKADRTESIWNLLQHVDQTLKERVAYENTSLVEIKSCTTLTGTESLFDSVVVIENYPLDKQFNNSNTLLQITSYEMLESTTYDLTVLVEISDPIMVQFGYHTQKFDREQIAHMAEHFTKILQCVITAPKERLTEMDLLTDYETQRILQQFNHTDAEYPKTSTIHALFEEQVEKYPDQMAAVYMDESLTYRELNAKANQLARTLRKRGVKPDTIVGILAERSLEMIVGIYGILKTGGAYLPIDPSYPEERIQFMLRDSETRILLTQSKHRDTVTFAGEIINLDDAEVYDKDGSNVPPVSNSHHLAYVIYTSGSTGKPKGVMIEHHSVINRLNWMQRKYPITGEDTILQKTPFTFDVSVWEMFWWSFQGAKVCFLTPGGEKDPETIVQAIEKYHVTTMHFVPSMLHIFLGHVRMNLERLHSLRRVFSSGEALHYQQVEQFNNTLYAHHGTTLHNLYGPTEATVDVTYFDCIPGRVMTTVPIGKPIDNTRIYIVNQGDQLQPIGVAGELCIAGVNLARGYLNRPELTAEKFTVRASFGASDGERVYRTGDLARWLPDGNIEYLGRLDYQVKIRGFRIELGEIEDRLLAHPAVQEAVVVDRVDQQGAKYLCAYIVSGSELTVGALRAYLATKLPEYMIPSYFVQMEQIPLTSNGKINRHVLPEPDGSMAMGMEYVAPRNQLEERLAAIWKDVLNVDSIGIHDHFFERGGHSLKATTLVAKIHKEFDVLIPLTQIFQTPTIAGISDYIQRTTHTKYELIPRAKDQELYAASPAQKRIYILEQMHPGNTAYNMTSLLHVEGELNLPQVEKAFGELIKRHETLRTSFETGEDQILAKVHQVVPFEVKYLDYTEEANDAAQSRGNVLTDSVLKAMVEGFVQPFDLSQAPLLRVQVIRLDANQHICLFDTHHIISDGLSVEILIQEFADLYEGKVLAELPIQYRDYAEWQNTLVQSEEMKKQETYWLAQFSDEVPVLHLQTDYPRSSRQQVSSVSISFRLDPELTYGLKRVALQHESTMFMVLLSGIQILLSKYSGQEDIIIGTPIAGRQHEDLEHLIGMFVNTLALRNRPEADKTYAEFLGEVKATAWAAFENQGYQFEELVNQLRYHRDLYRNPLFDVMFAMQTVNLDELKVGELKFTPLKHENKRAKFDLSFAATETTEEIRFELEFCVELFKRDTIERMVTHLQQIYKAITANPRTYLRDIQMLTDEEMSLILDGFNQASAEFPRDRTLPDVFAEQVAMRPDQIAVVYEHDQLTYRELNQKANYLARLLRERGVRPNRIVGLLVNRSVEMFIGMMAILKAGGAYMPISPDYPEERIRFMLTNSKTELLLTEEEFMGRESCASVQTINLKNMDAEVDVFHVNSPTEIEPNAERLQPADLAYVIYTSGSTGNPKGVMIEHHSVLSLVAGLAQIIYGRYESPLNVALVAPYYFDASVKQIFAALLLGHTLCIVPEDVRFNGTKLLAFYHRHSIDISDGTPNHLILLANIIDAEERNIQVKHFVIGGDILTGNILKEFYAKYSENPPYITNIYGPTECCVDNTAYLIDPANLLHLHSIPIGKTMANEAVYILDQNMQVLPIGVPGEMYIGGEGVGRGYLNNPELTAARFVDNPFRPGTRMYRTGDQARWLPDGNVEFFGRMDYQVKIRGYRIELGEIENRLLAHPAVKEVVVIDRVDPHGEKYLCAYIVSRQEVTVRALRAFLATTLPEYMIPSYFVQLDQLPLTLNGKVNRKALPEPDGSMDTGKEYAAPRNQLEERLAAIWKGILKVDRIGIDDHFFELGGHSLKATTLVAKLHNEFDVLIPLSQIFQTPTIAGISEYIQKAMKDQHEDIQRVEDQEHYAASPAQKRIYILEKMHHESIAYNMPGILRVEGDLNLQQVAIAFAELIKRHETLRTSFETGEDQILQKVHKEVPFEVEYLEDLGPANDAVGSVVLTDSIIEEMVEGFIRPFDLSRAPLLRVKVIRLDSVQHICMFDMHHIISDGLSMEILIKEFTALYEGKRLAELPIQYRDYAVWQNTLLQSEAMKKQETYWLAQFRDEVPVLQLQTDYPRSVMQHASSVHISFQLDPGLTRGLKRVALQHESTLFMVLLSGIQILLSKYTGQEDIIIGTPIAGRTHHDLEQLIGMFVNTLAMRNQPMNHKTYAEFLGEVKATAWAAFENQGYQFEELVNRLYYHRDLNRNPLFDVMFAMQNVKLDELRVGDLKFTPLKHENRRAKFDLTFSATETSEEIKFELEYCVELFKRDTIERMAAHLQQIYAAITANPQTTLRDIPMLSDAEMRLILDSFNQAYAEFPKDRTLPEVFAEQVAVRHDQTAVVYENDQLTYQELNQKANSVAQLLRKRGVRPNTVVGLLVNRSVEMIIGIMAILKAGGAYMPISPDYPEERVRFMLDNSKAEVLLTEEQFIGRESCVGVQAIDMKNLDMEMDRIDANPPVESAPGMEQLQPSDLAYVIYTSGSTGNPKGVMIEQHSVISLVTGLARIIFERYESPLNVALVAPYYFDASVQQIFATLLLGHTLCIVPEDVRLDGRKLLSFYHRYAIDISDGTPNHLSLLANAIGSAERSVRVKHFIIGGDTLTVNVLEEFYAQYTDNPPDITNIYGPTECCVDNVAYLIEPADRIHLHSIPIGKTIANEVVYILDKDMQVLPIGVPGEMYIGGEGVGRGYLNNPELTAARFVDNPFRPGTRMYRTGDQARWLSDGNIEFICRMDHQVKIRGFRIELGEIENQLLTHLAIKEAVVIAREDHHGVKYLTAYVVSDEEVTASELREYLSSKLPEYMIPSYFIQLPQIPITANGKTDRKALPEPQIQMITGTEYTAPENETEEKLVQIWREVLGFEQIGTHDNFFELGGHSLNATILLGKIHKAFDVEMPLSEIFKTPTICGISLYIQSAVKTVYETIARVTPRDSYEASSAQKRMYLLQQLNLEGTGYNMPGVLEICGDLEIARVERAFGELISRHETLRTSFATLGDRIVQRIEPEVEFTVKFENAGTAADRSNRTVTATVAKILEEFVQPFDLSKAPLFRVKVVRLADDQHLLIFDMHHIISDGMSMDILVREFARLYEGKELEALPIQYKDYAEWQNTRLQSDSLKKQKEYWMNRLGDELPVLHLPTDFPRPTMPTHAGDHVQCTFHPEMTATLRRISRETGSTMFMILLSGFSILLSKYSGQEDIIVGTPIAGRPHVNLQKIIGIFVNTLALRSEPGRDKTFREFLQEVKVQTLQAYENQEYPFEELVEQLHLKRDFGRNPIFDVMLNLQETGFSGFTIDNLTFTPVTTDADTSKFDLTLAVTMQNQQIEVNFVYSTALFRRETIERMAGHFVRILEVISGDCDIRLADIDMLTEAERRVLVYDWNQTAADDPDHQILHQIFEAQAEQCPNQIALIGTDQQLTYQQVNEEANQLGRVLRAKGVGPETIIGILVERSFAMIIAILGVLKAGGAYLPLLPDYPIHRIQGILEDSQAKLLVTLPEFDVVLDMEIEKVYLNDPCIDEEDGANLTLINKPTDLAYVLYTSGSTGKPKGVMVEHRSVVNTLSHLQRQYPLDSTDIVLQSTVYTFDASIREIFWWFFNGAGCCLLGHDEEKDPVQIVETIAAKRVTLVKFVPLLLNEVLNTVSKLGIEKVRSLKYVLVGGETLTGELVRKFYDLFTADTVFCNLYGPTETSIHCTEYVLRAPIREPYAPIGRPIRNDQVYILDARMNPVPVGVTGEIYIGGVGVARGYLNQPELTAERFIANPFQPGERMYKTGDLGRWMADGNVEFQGRIDHQVKIRGYRIELGEIENQLLKFAGVSESVVVDRKDQQGVPYLCAYIVGAQGSEIHVTDIRKFLADQLPDYMVPAQVILLDQMPLTNSGKVDRKALPEPDGGNLMTGIAYQPPTNPIEERLAAIWQELLGVTRVGIDDNFFELGGHSFTVITMSGMIHQEWSVELPLRVVFQQPTVRELAQYIQKAGKTNYIPIKSVEKEEDYPVSPAQKRFYVLHQLEDVQTVYNMPHVFLVEGDLDVNRLEEVYRALIQRHESLRTSFAMRRGEPVQIVHDNVEAAIARVAARDDELEEMIQQLIQPFDLALAPLLRVALIETETRQILFFDSNHILLDGVSMEVLISDLMKLYQGQPLNQPGVQYKDFVVWQQELVTTGQMQEQEEYWLNTLQSPLPGLDLPTDYPRPANENFAGDHVSVLFDLDMSTRIHQFTHEHAVTMYVFLLAVYNILLAKYTDQEDLLVGTVTAGRTHPDIEKTVGMFINTLPMRNYPAGGKSFIAFLQEVKENTFRVYENQDYPFEMMVRQLGIHWAPGENPLLKTLFFSPTFGDSTEVFEQLQLTPITFEKPTARFDVLAYMMPEQERIHLLFEYKTALFKRATMEKMSDHYVQIAEQVLENPAILLKEITLSHQIQLAKETVFDDGDFGF